MTEPNEQIARFESVAQVVKDSLRFKQRLGIGDNVYWTSRYGKYVQQLWDVGGVAATGASIAKSASVASTFFGATGLWASLGFGTAATPAGWVVAAAVVSGGAYYGVTSLFRSYFGSKSDVIPKFINTPIDLLGANLFDLIVPLAVKLARIDGDFAQVERVTIQEYFVEDWGFAPEYVAAALPVIEENTTDESLNDLVVALAEFKSANPDCNYTAMSKELIGFLKDIARADGILDEREEMAIERVQKVLNERGRISFASIKNRLWARRSG